MLDDIGRTLRYPILRLIHWLVITGFKLVSWDRNKGQAAVILIPIFVYEILAICVYKYFEENYSDRLASLVTSYILYFFGLYMTQVVKVYLWMRHVYKTEYMPDLVNGLDPFISADGVTLSVILEFVELCGGRSALQGLASYEVKEVFLLKMQGMEARNISYCELMKKRKEGETRVRKANVFVSHTWGYKFIDVVDALEAYDRAHKRQNMNSEIAKSRNNNIHNSNVDECSESKKDEIVYWFDFFTDNNKEKNLPVWWLHLLQETIKNIGTTVAVMAPWNKPDILSRVFCLWELFCSLRTGAVLDVAMCDNEASDFLKNVVIDESIISQIMKVEVQNSKGKKEAEEISIKTLVSTSFGYDNMNSFVRIAMERSYINVIQRRVDDILRNNLPTNDNCVCCAAAGSGGNETIDTLHHDDLVLISVLANMVRQRGEFDKALYYLSCLRIAAGMAYHTVLPSALLTTGDVHFRMGNYDAAINAYLELKDISQQSPKYHFKANLRLSEVFITLENITQADSCLSELESCYLTDAGINISDSVGGVDLVENYEYICVKACLLSLCLQAKYPESVSSIYTSLPSRSDINISLLSGRDLRRNDLDSAEQGINLGKLEFGMKIDERLTVVQNDDSSSSSSSSNYDTTHIIMGHLVAIDNMFREALSGLEGLDVGPFVMSNPIHLLHLKVRLKYAVYLCQFKLNSFGGSLYCSDFLERLFKSCNHFNNVLTKMSTIFGKRHEDYLFALCDYSHVKVGLICFRCSMRGKFEFFGSSSIGFSIYLIANSEHHHIYGDHSPISALEEVMETVSVDCLNNKNNNNKSGSSKVAFLAEKYLEEYKDKFDCMHSAAQLYRRLYYLIIFAIPLYYDSFDGFINPDGSTDSQGYLCCESREEKMHLAASIWVVIPIFEAYLRFGNFLHLKKGSLGLLCFDTITFLNAVFIVAMVFVEILMVLVTILQPDVPDVIIDDCYFILKNNDDLDLSNLNMTSLDCHGEISTPPEDRYHLLYVYFQSSIIFYFGSCLVIYISEELLVKNKAKILYNYF